MNPSINTTPGASIMNQGNTGGIIAFSIVVILVLLGIREDGGMESVKQDLLALLETLK
jgi:hypothetical protein